MLTSTDPIQFEIEIKTKKSDSNEMSRKTNSPTKNLTPPQKKKKQNDEKIIWLNLYYRGSRGKLRKQRCQSSSKHVGNV